MNHFLKPAALVLFMTIGIYCNGQQIVQTPEDIQLICQLEEQFIGKPLKSLFHEIKPPIRLVLAREGWIPEVVPVFIFFFTSKQVYDQYRRKDSFPLRLTVYLKEPFKWDWQKRKGFKDRDHYMDWEKEDEEKYGNLTIGAIRIAGDYNPCDYSDIPLTAEPLTWVSSAGAFVIINRPTRLVNYRK